MKSKSTRVKISAEQKIYYSVKEEYEKAALAFSITRNRFWPDLSFIKDYVKKNSKLLDFGCGNGRLLKLINPTPENYQGLDVSQNLIQIARKNYPRYQFDLIDPLLRKIPKRIKNQIGKFDLIVSLGVFHHFPPGRRRELILKKLSTFLAPQGIMIVSVWRLNPLKYSRYLKNRTGFIPFKDSKGKLIFSRYLYFWEKEELSRFMEKAGLRVITSGETYYNKKPANIYWVGRR